MTLSPLVASTPLGTLFRLLVLLWLPFYAFVVFNDVRGVRLDSERTLVDDTRLVTEAVRATMTTHTAMLLSVGEGLLSLGALDTPENGRTLIERMVESDPGMAGFGLARTDGQLVLVSRTPPSVKLPNLTSNDESRASFNEALQSNKIHAGRAYFFKTLGEWVIPIRIAVRDVSGKPRAVMTAGYRIDGGTAAWARMSLGQGISILLLHDDGYALYQNPLLGEDRTTLYGKVYGQPFASGLLQQLRGLPGNSGIIETTVDGIPMLGAWHLLNEYGLYALTLKPVYDIERSQWASLVTPTLWLLSFLFGGYIVYQRTSRLQRAADAQQEMAEMEVSRQRDTAQRYLDIAGVMLMALDMRGRIKLINKKGAQILGKPEAELLGADWFEGFVPADQRGAVRQVFDQILSGKSQLVEHYENRVINAAGQEVLLAWSNSILRDETGAVVGILSSAEDITERREAQMLLHESRERFDLAVRGSSDGIWDWNIETGLTYVSDRWLEMLGYRPGEISFGPKDWTNWIHPDDRNLAISKMREHLKTRKPYSSEYRMTMKNGEYRWFLNRGQAIWNAEGRATRIAGSTSDITERKVGEDQLRKLSLAVEQSPESVVITNLSAEIEYVNEAFVHKTGYSREEAIGKNPRILHSGKTPAETFSAMWDALSQGQPWKGDLHNRRKDGSEYIEHAVITPIRQPDGSVTHYVAVKEDITSQKASEEQINTLAFYDPLTILPNRRLLLDRLKQALASSARSKRYGALLFIDLDNFKTLNDTLGHDIGDLLLQQVAQRLITCVREGDTVSRLGGDEFVVMLEDLSENIEESATQSKIVGEKILSTLNQSYQLANYPHHSTPSIGVTLFTDQQETIEELLKRADLAMYQAKAAGRNTLRFFDPEMQAVVTARAAMEADLREAVLKDQFLPHYQAQVVGEGRITGVEVLLRWQHPKLGMVSPADFIPLAEDTGLILPIGHWVLQTACTQLALWAARPEMAHLTIAVNVSARQFRHKDFVDQVLAMLDHTGANPQCLKLELTESLLVDDVESVITKMAALKMKGVGFSMDDFGTGYSSLSYLKRLPLDQLKIDQGFVRDILTDANDAAIARMVVVLAESLGLVVIAEGVETEAQREYLAHHGCHAYQGYLFSRPLPLDDFERLACKAFDDEQRLLRG